MNHQITFPCPVPAHPPPRGLQNRIRQKELVHQERYKTRAAARRSIFEYIEVFYNRERIHSSLGYVSSEKFERLA